MGPSWRNSTDGGGGGRAGRIAGVGGWEIGLRTETLTLLGPHAADPRLHGGRVQLVDNSARGVTMRLVVAQAPDD